jgi:release factor glutamine methyltransferase
MNKEELYKKIVSDLGNKIHFLEDKPEETAETTVKALWHTAAGNPVSAERSLKLPLPDLTDEQISTLSKLIETRLNNTPLAHITNRQSFLDMEMLADSRALIPRKETEILGRKALEIARGISAIKNEVRIIDTCCGSGNLGLAVACNIKNCVVYSSDLSQEATELTRDNISFLKLSDRVHVAQGDLLGAFDNELFYGNIDLIICNPPYIQSSRVDKMDSEISANEPVLAFDGGMLGIKIIQKLISEAPKYLTAGGWLAFEIGAGQGDFITKLCERSQSYMNIQTVSDKAGVIRVIFARRSE